MIHFMKGKINYGELRFAKFLKNFKIEQYDRRDFVDKDNPAEVERKLALEVFERTRQVIAGRKYNIVILDELSVAVNYGLIPIKSVLGLFKKVPKKMEVIVTG